jgi:hypothetical protein
VAVASLIVAMLALILAAASFFDGRRRAVEANKAADRAAAAAERQTELAEREAEKYSPPWRLEPGPSGSAWTLTNDGHELAAGVRVRPVHESLVLINTPNGVDIGPGSAVKFVVSLDEAVKDERVRIMWRRPGELTDREWIRPVG